MGEFQESDSRDFAKVDLAFLDDGSLLFQLVSHHGSPYQSARVYALAGEHASLLPDLLSLVFSKSIPNTNITCEFEHTVFCKPRI